LNLNQSPSNNVIALWCHIDEPLRTGIKICYT